MAPRIEVTLPNGDKVTVKAGRADTAFAYNPSGYNNPNTQPPDPGDLILTLSRVDESTGQFVGVAQFREWESWQRVDK